MRRQSRVTSSFASLSLTFWIGKAFKLVDGPGCTCTQGRAVSVHLPGPPVGAGALALLVALRLTRSRVAGFQRCGHSVGSVGGVSGPALARTCAGQVTPASAGQWAPGLSPIAP